MVHPAIIGSIIAMAVVGTIAVIILLEERNRPYEEPIHANSQRGQRRGSARGLEDEFELNGKQNMKKKDAGSGDESDDDDDDRQGSRNGQSSRDKLWEKFGIRKRRGKSLVLDMEEVGTSPVRDTDARESELQERLSYMTAMEQEIERKKQFLVHEQALLIKQEDDLRARREKLQTLGNTITGLPNDSPLMTSPTYLVDEDETTSASASAASASTVILPGIGLGIVNESAAASPPHPLDARTPGFSTPTTSAAGSTTLSPPPQHSTPLMGPLYSQTRLRVPSDVSGHSSAGSWSDIGFGLVTPDPLLGGATPSIDGTTLSVGGFEDEGSVRGSIVSEVLGSPSLGGSEVGLEGSEDFVEIEEEELIERARWR